MYPNDFSALGGIGKIYERKLSIPKDISVVGYDGIPLAKALMPPLTTLEQPSGEMGEDMAQQLISLIEDAQNTDVEQVVIKGKVYQGKSVKRLEVSRVSEKILAELFLYSYCILCIFMYIILLVC